MTPYHTVIICSSTSVSVVLRLSQAAEQGGASDPYFFFFYNKEFSVNPKFIMLSNFHWKKYRPNSHLDMKPFISKFQCVANLVYYHLKKKNPQHLPPSEQDIYIILCSHSFRCAPPLLTVRYNTSWCDWRANIHSTTGIHLRLLTRSIIC